MNICIICPVRLGVPSEVLEYVEALEANGHTVHFPPRDNKQDDPIGLGICESMKNAIKGADEIHIFYSEDSQGCHFDLGMAFMAGKKLKLINTPEDKLGKSYIKVIRAYEDSFV